MDLSHFFDVCQQVASSAGELASLVVLAALAYLLAVVRSLRLRVTEVLASRMSSRSGSAQARRKRSPSGLRSSSASPTGLAAMSPFHPSQPEVSEDGLSQALEKEGQLSLEEHLSLHPPQADVRQPLALVGAGADGPNSAGRPAAVAGDRADRYRADDGRAAAEAGSLLGGKRPENAG